MVLDVMLPDMEGFDVAERLGAQRADVPIIFLTARDATTDKVRGLTTGGDDYVTKPFSLEELIARIRTILRRTGRAEAESSRLVFEDLEIDEDTREVTRAGEPIELTATEYRLLRYFMLNPRRVLTRAQLLDNVWDYDFGGDGRVLETYVSYLRKKLDVHGPPLIHTARGVGYALRLPRGVLASLRARLLVGVVALAAVGLLRRSAASSTPQQRDFLLDRVDDQARARSPVMNRALDEHGVAGRRRPRAPGGGPGAAAGRRFGPPPDGRRTSRPASTAQRRDASGSVLGDTAIVLARRARTWPARAAREHARGRRVITVGAQDDSGLRYRAVATARRARRRDDRRGRPADRVDAAARPPAARRGARHRRRARSRSAGCRGSSSASACARWTASARRPARSPRGDLSRRVEPGDAEAPRSAGWGSRSTRCSSASSRPSPSARPARTACAASWPTPRTSCARRWRRSAATPSCSAWAPRATPRAPRRR